MCALSANIIFILIASHWRSELVTGEYIVLSWLQCWSTLFLMLLRTLTIYFFVDWPFFSIHQSFDLFSPILSHLRACFSSTSELHQHLIYATTRPSLDSL